jgi:hypothetical protein
MGQLVGYTVADYLIQHTTRQRRTARMPASLRDALLSHIGDPADAARLANSARGRLLYCYAIPLHRHAVDGSDKDVASRLAVLLAIRGNQDEALQILRANNLGEDLELANLLAEDGDLDEAVQILRPRVDAGDTDQSRR